jgi:radical SAM superfamily enzyme
MAEQYLKQPEIFQLFDVDEYIELLVDFVERLNPSIAIERIISQSNKDLLIVPQWSIKNFEFTDKLKKRMLQRETYQGKLYK